MIPYIWCWWSHHILRASPVTIDINGTCAVNVLHHTAKLFYRISSAKLRYFIKNITPIMPWERAQISYSGRSFLLCSLSPPAGAMYSKGLELLKILIQEMCNASFCLWRRCRVKHLLPDFPTVDNYYSPRVPAEGHPVIILGEPSNPKWEWDWANWISLWLSCSSIRIGLTHKGTLRAKLLLQRD